VAELEGALSGVVFVDQAFFFGEVGEAGLVFLNGSVGLSVFGDVCHELGFEFRCSGEGGNGEGDE